MINIGFLEEVAQIIFWVTGAETAPWYNLFFRNNKILRNICMIFLTRNSSAITKLVAFTS